MSEPASSLSREINAERLMLLAWSRAILLQLAHPLVAAGVAEHSTFRGGPLRAAIRLHHTVRAMLALSFGRPHEVEAALDGIRTIHRRVHGRLPNAVGTFAAGTPYSAEDPALVLWVHCTLLDSIPPLFDRLIRPLTPSERDQYCADAAWVATALGASDSDVPRTQAALDAYLTRMYGSGQIAVGPEARELAHAVLTPPLAIAVAPASRINWLVTVGMLPEPIRRQYGFDWGARQERAMARALRLVAAMRRVTLRQLAWWPEARRGGSPAPQ